ncbi:alpha/beta-hydrolase [Annulohypoxylon nitens]|nr:alpha/beta-hydrolase [Annulohypoxylon nitens]
MASKKPTVVIVHGAWHVPECYDKLVATLQSADYEVYVPHLPSTNGTRPPDGNLVTDTALVGTNALYGLSYQVRMKQGLPGGVLHLIYMCAFILPEGWSTLDQGRSRGIEIVKATQLKLVFDDEGYCTMVDPRGQLINNVNDDDEAAAYISKLVPWSAKCMTQPLSHCAWRDIPVTYIHTTNDKTITFVGQKLMLERLKGIGLPDPLLVTLDTDHCPHITATGDIVNIIGNTVANVKKGIGLM